MKLGGGRVKSNGRRAELDTYHTPFCAIESLMLSEKFKGKILEPACGDGLLAGYIRDFGYNVVAQDIKTGYNFFEHKDKVDNVITNPPFSLAHKFIEHALSISRRKVAFLLRLSFLEGQKRFKLYQDIPPSTVYVFSNRLPFQDADGNWSSSGGQFCHAWFIWDHGYSGPTCIKWLLHNGKIKEVH